jgi:hypothetical protein
VPNCICLTDGGIGKLVEDVGFTVEFMEGLAHNTTNAFPVSMFKKEFFTCWFYVN